MIAEFTDALLDGPGAAGRATLYTGARGAGKTVMLNEIEDRAKSRGWVVVSETATSGLVDRLTQSRLPELLRVFDPDAVRRQLTGIKLPLTGGRRNRLAGSRVARRQGRPSWADQSVDRSACREPDRPADNTR